MVLIVLIVLWSIVLVPPAWAAHTERRRARQVDAFRRRLSVLAPAPDTPLARRPMDAARPFEAARAHVAVIAPRNVVQLPVAEAETEAEAEPIEYDTGELTAVAASAAARRADRARSRIEVLRRRRQVLTGLIAATVVSLITALLAGDTRVWTAHGVVIISLAAYLATLRRLRKLALERRTKVRYLPAMAQAPAAADEVRAPEVRSAAR
ncbi:MAG TPA: hypothetical protein VFF24_01235 [Acidimicrobiia bacterium]|jgi:hypothetical protein|nr:hypothetical protein [Acidimicrobiia bacterium]